MREGLDLVPLGALPFPDQLHQDVEPLLVGYVVDLVNAPHPRPGGGDAPVDRPVEYLEHGIGPGRIRHPFSAEAAKRRVEDPPTALGVGGSSTRRFTASAENGWRIRPGPIPCSRYSTGRSTGASPPPGRGCGAFTRSTTYPTRRGSTSWWSWSGNGRAPRGTRSRPSRMPKGYPTSHRSSSATRTSSSGSTIPATTGPVRQSTCGAATPSGWRPSTST